VSKRWFYAIWAVGIGAFAVLHALNLTADFPNHTPLHIDWAKYTDEGWYGDGAIRHFQRGHWYVPGDFNPAAALPVWPLLEAALFHFTGVNLTAARALTVTIFGLILLASYFLVRRWQTLSSGKKSETQKSETKRSETSLAPALAVLLLALVSAVFAQAPSPCEAPRTFQAWHHYYDETTGQWSNGEYYEDSINYRKAYQFYRSDGTSDVQEWLIQLWDPRNPSLQGTEYTIYPQKNQCTEDKTDYGWQGHGIPANAQFVSEEYLGTSAFSGGGVLVQTWASMFASGAHYRTYTVQGCVPIKDTHINNSTNPPDVGVENWFDVVLGIANPNVFVPPAICPV